MSRDQSWQTIKEALNQQIKSNVNSTVSDPWEKFQAITGKTKQEFRHDALKSTIKRG